MLQAVFPLSPSPAAVPLAGGFSQAAILLTTPWVHLSPILGRDRMPRVVGCARPRPWLLPTIPPAMAVCCPDNLGEQFLFPTPCSLCSKPGQQNTNISKHRSLERGELAVGKAPSKTTTMTQLAVSNALHTPMQLGSTSGCRCARMHGCGMVKCGGGGTVRVRNVCLIVSGCVWMCLVVSGCV